ncbi:MAG: hypothetical protein P8185_21000 [Deltaproteobacteria bacterium]
MKLSPVAELSSKDRRILLNTCYGHFMSHFNMLVFPALVLPLTARLGLGMAQVLELSFWMYLLFGLTALFWGLVADRFGARRLLCGWTLRYFLHRRWPLWGFFQEFTILPVWA